MGRNTKVALPAMLALVLVSSIALADTWRGPFPIAGTGVSDCGDSRATAVAWSLCRQKALEASTIAGIPVSVVDISTSYNRTDEEGPWYDHWHSCKFSGTAQC